MPGIQHIEEHGFVDLPLAGGKDNAFHFVQQGEDEVHRARRVKVEDLLHQFLAVGCAEGGAFQGARLVQRVGFLQPQQAFEVFIGDQALAGITAVGALVDAREGSGLRFTPQKGIGVQHLAAVGAAGEVEVLEVFFQAFLAAFDRRQPCQQGLKAADLRIAREDLENGSCDRVIGVDDDAAARSRLQEDSWG